MKYSHLFYSQSNMTVILLELQEFGCVTLFSPSVIEVIGKETRPEFCDLYEGVTLLCMAGQLHFCAGHFS